MSDMNQENTPISSVGLEHSDQPVVLHSQVKNAGVEVVKDPIPNISPDDVSIDLSGETQKPSLNPSNLIKLTDDEFNVFLSETPRGGGASRWRRILAGREKDKSEIRKAA